MFEVMQQTDARRGLRPVLAFCVSVVLHVVGVVVLVIIPLIAFRVIPASEFVAFVFMEPVVVAPQLPPAPTPAVAQPVAVRRVSAPSVLFREPTVVPIPIAPPDEEPPAADIVGGAITGRSGSSAGIPGPMPGRMPGSTLSVLMEGIVTASVNPPKPRPPTAPLRGGDVLESKLIYRVDPVYPPLAMRARTPGVVILQLLLDEEGKVASVKVLRSHPLFEAAAVEAVRQWRYSPTLLNGEPVPVIGTVTVVFKLNTP